MKDILANNDNWLSLVTHILGGVLKQVFELIFANNILKKIKAFSFVKFW